MLKLDFNAGKDVKAYKTTRTQLEKIFNHLDTICTLKIQHTFREKDMDVRIFHPAFMWLLALRDIKREHLIFQSMQATRDGVRVYGHSVSSGQGFASAVNSVQPGCKAAVISVSFDETNLGGNYSHATAIPIVFEVLNAVRGHSERYTAGFLPISKALGRKEERKTADFKKAYFKYKHEVLSRILQSLEDLAVRGFRGAFRTGVVDTFYPRLIAAPLDYPEACDTFAIVRGWCCQCPFQASDDPIQLMKIFEKLQQRSESRIKGAFRNQEKSKLKRQGCQYRTNPFWDLPTLIPCKNGCYGIAFADKLHGLFLGIVKYWLRLVMELFRLHKTSAEAERRSGLISYTFRKCKYPTWKDFNAKMLTGREYVALLMGLPHVIGGRASLVGAEISRDIVAGTEKLITFVLAMTGHRSYTEVEIQEVLVDQVGARFVQHYQAASLYVAKLEEEQNEGVDEESKEELAKVGSQKRIFKFGRKGKLHRIFGHLTESLVWAGALTAVDTSANESNHIIHKDNYDQTSKRGNTAYQKDLRKRYFQNFILEDLSQWSTDSEIEGSDSDEVESEGTHNVLPNPESKLMYSSPVPGEPQMPDDLKLPEADNDGGSGNHFCTNQISHAFGEGG